MKRLVAHAAAAVVAALPLLLAAPAAVDAKTLRWASQGDPQTADPFSQNEGLTNMFSQSVHDTLVMRDNALKLVPGLATSWQQVNATTWRFTLRRGVKFHDGSPFTADDVVFSYERAAHPNSQLRQYAIPVGKPRKIDEFTVEFVQERPNPVILEHATTIYIMSKAWAEKHKVTAPLDFKNKEETHASRNANGTGPWILVAREPGVRTVVRRNADWWGIKEGRAPGNVTEVVYTQVSADATRTAALLSGNVDFVLDPPPQDLARLENNKDTKVVRGQENRVVFFGFDQSRDELLYSNIKGRNPFKDLRVRQAVYHAIDIEAIRARTMRGSALPTGGITPSILASNPDAEKRLPFDPARARQLLAEAGYPNGFEVTLDCPNNRYVNDEEICIAVAAMLTRVGIAARVTAMPRATYFPKLEKHDTSFYMLGWGGAITDAQTTLDPVLRSQDKATGKGFFNYGRYSNPKLDALIDAAGVEPNADKRRELIRQALAEHNANVHHVPLHRQMIPWSMRQNIHVVHRADNVLIFESVRID
ncbi:MAG: ABC transporter substrate-binding protein [Burkholderiaceae bacterium]|jgi:peptide/nickel transport system substrate-binding protein|nr:ABC transporter substrate-binding protein [Burkholderiaceae bacterium]